MKPTNFGKTAGGQMRRRRKSKLRPRDRENRAMLAEHSRQLAFYRHIEKLMRLSRGNAIMNAQAEARRQRRLAQSGEGVAV